MPKSGYCKECSKNDWLKEDGSLGHPTSLGRKNPNIILPLVLILFILFTGFFSSCLKSKKSDTASPKKSKKQAVSSGVRNTAEELVKLDVSSPEAGTEVTVPSVEVVGTSEAGAIVTINGTKVATDPKTGDFKSVVNLVGKEVENTIEIIARKKGKQEATWVLTNITVLSPEAVALREEARRKAEEEARTTEVRAIVVKQLKGKNNQDKKYIRQIDIVEQVNGGWGVFVEYNADENLTTNLTRVSMEKKMSEIYIALYTSDKDIRAASVAAYFPLSDKYGNVSDEIGYKSILNREEADKVNWGADEASLKISILPKVWTTTILHPDFRK